MEVKGTIENVEQNNEKRIYIQIRRQEYRSIEKTDIVYLERRGRVTYIHTKDDVLETYKTMSEMESLFQDDCFVRCHNSYIVSMRYIYRYKREEVIIEKDIRIHFSTVNLRYHQYEKCWNNLDANGIVDMIPTEFYETVKESKEEALKSVKNGLDSMGETLNSEYEAGCSYKIEQAKNVTVSMYIEVGGEQSQSTILPMISVAKVGDLWYLMP